MPHKVDAEDCNLAPIHLKNLGFSQFVWKKYITIFSFY